MLHNGKHWQNCEFVDDSQTSAKCSHLFQVNWQYYSPDRTNSKLKGPKVYIYQTAYSILPFSLPTDPLGGHILYIIKPHLCQPSPTQNHCVAN